MMEVNGYIFFENRCNGIFVLLGEQGVTRSYLGMSSRSQQDQNQEKKKAFQFPIPEGAKFRLLLGIRVERVSVPELAF